jgi:biopolymer transport protein ExbD
MGTRALAYRHRNQEPEPFASMNITPLIDVMLVILVMMILSVPLMTNKVPLDLASGKPDPQKIVTHIVDLDAAGTLALDGAPLDLATLKGRLARMRADPNAELQIRADAHARYERFDQALAAIKGAGITRLGFIGNEQFADFSTR